MAQPVNPQLGWPNPDVETPPNTVTARVREYPDASSGPTYTVYGTTRTDAVEAGETYPQSAVGSNTTVRQAWDTQSRSTPIRAVTSIPDDDLIIAGYGDGVVGVYDALSGATLVEQPLHTQRITDIATDIQGRIATSARDGQVVVSEYNDADQVLTEILRHSRHDDPNTGIKEDATAVGIANGDVYSGDKTGTVKAVTIADETLSFEHSLHEGSVTGIAGYTVESVTLDSAAIGDTDQIFPIDTIDMVFSCADDGFIGGVYAEDKTVSSQDGTGNTTLAKGTGRWNINTDRTLNDLAIDERLIAVGDNGYIKEFSDWNGDASFESQTLSKNLAGVTVGGETAYVTSADQTVQAVDVASQSIVWEHTFHSGRVFDAAVTVDTAGDRRITTAGDDYYLRQVEPVRGGGLFTTLARTDAQQVRYDRVGELQWRFPDGNDGAHDLAVEPANNYAYVATLGGTIVALDTTDGSERWRHDLHSGDDSAYGVSTLDDGSGRELVASAGTDQGVRLFDGSDGVRSQLDIHGFHNTSIYSVSAKDSDIISSDAGGRVVATELAGQDNATMSKTWEHTYHSGSIYEITIYKDRVYTASSDGTVVAAKRSDGSKIWQVSHHGGQALRSVDADDSIVVTGGFDNAVVAMDTSDGSVKWRHTHHYRNVYGVHVGDDGVIYSGAYDNHVRAAARTDGTLLWSHNIQDNSVRDIKVIGNQVISASWDGTVISVDDAIFYPFSDTGDPTTLELTDYFSPADFDQQVHYAFATEVNGTQSPLRVAETVNIPFRYSDTLGPAVGGVGQTAFSDELDNVFVDLSTVAFAGPITQINIDPTPVSLVLNTLVGSTVQFETFVRFGTINIKRTILTPLINPDGVTEVARANQLETLFAELRTTDRIREDNAKAFARPTQPEGIIGGSDVFLRPLAPVDERPKIIASGVTQVTEKVFASDEETVIVGPEILFDDFNVETDTPPTLIAQLDIQEITTDTAKARPTPTATTSVGVTKSLDPTVRATDAIDTAFAGPVFEYASAVSARGFFDATGGPAILFDDFNVETETPPKPRAEPLLSFASTARAIDDATAVESLVTVYDSVVIESISLSTVGSVFTVSDEFVLASEDMRAVVGPAILFDDFNVETETPPKPRAEPLLDVTMRAQAIESATATAVTFDRLASFVTASDRFRAFAGEIGFVRSDVPFRVLLTDNILAAPVTALTETTRFAQFIGVDLDDTDRVDYVERDTVPIQTELPTDLIGAAEVRLNMDPVGHDGPDDMSSDDLGGTAAIRNREDGVVAYRFDEGETVAPGPYEITFTIVFSEITQRTFPTSGPLTLFIRPR
jgi:outer membrane protein assembly factor BamB